MTLNSLRILLTGATGYIGGSILSALLDSSALPIRDFPITCLLRGPERAKQLTAAFGDHVKPVLYEGLDDLETTIRIATKHDIVINTTHGFHEASAKALVQGLGQRKVETGRGIWIIHTAGCSNIGDRPILHPESVRPPLDDIADDVYGYEKELETAEQYGQRTTELGVIDTALELGVKALSIMSPMIYGNGKGLFNKISAQTTYIHVMLKMQRAMIVGAGDGVWNHVHIEDLADLYTLMVRDILENSGQKVPSGKKGIMFSGNGKHTWSEFTTDQARACYAEGLIPSQDVDHVSLDEAARLMVPAMSFSAAAESLGERNKGLVEAMFASNAQTIASASRKLGWTPTKGEEVWKAAFRDDVKAVAAKMGIERMA
jgi:nucleoside-diphosphate-sugar epimerase